VIAKISFSFREIRDFVFAFSFSVFVFGFRFGETGLVQELWQTSPCG